VLAQVDAEGLAALSPQLELVPLPVPRMLHAEGKLMRHVYFPIEGVISMLGSFEATGQRIEVGTIGREGVAGLSVFFGATRATGDTFMQVSGEGWRMPAAAFVQAANGNASLAKALHRYAQSLFVQVTQALACNSAHSPEQRCARWLLMTHDRVSGDTFDLKQEFLAQMLGERRVTVSKAASKLRERGIISYSRGKIQVRDRQRLEHAACSCYGIIRKQYDASSD